MRFNLFNKKVLSVAFTKKPTGAVSFSSNSNTIKVLTSHSSTGLAEAEEARVILSNNRMLINNVTDFNEKNTSQYDRSPLHFGRDNHWRLAFKEQYDQFHSGETKQESHATFALKKFS